MSQFTDFVPEIINTDENKASRKVVTAQRWNELWNLGIHQGNSNAAMIYQLCQIIDDKLELADLNPEAIAAQVGAATMGTNDTAAANVQAKLTFLFNLISGITTTGIADNTLGHAKFEVALKPTFIYPANTSPTANDDSTKGFWKGNFWIDFSKTPLELWICESNAVGLASWEKLQNGNKGSISGIDSFAGPGLTTTVTHNLNIAPNLYVVQITPEASGIGYVGDFGVTKSTNSFTVSNTGSATTDFGWTITLVGGTIDTTLDGGAL